MAGGNRGLLSQLGATESAPYFSNPADNSRKVWCFADVPHLLKLLRNHFLDHGICLPSGTVIKKDTLLQLMDRDNDELKIVHKLTPLHLNAVGMERQKVRIAAQLFSRTTAAAIRYLFPDKMEMAYFFQLVNDAFDILNTRIKTGHFQTTSAYGTHLDMQNQILDSMHGTVAGMRIVGKKTLLPFQKGFLMSITAVKGLFASLQALYNVQYILTARLNQDCLENFFSQLRGIGHHYDHPTPAEVKHRFRLLLVARNCVDLNNSNVRRDGDTDDNCLLPDDNDSPNFAGSGEAAPSQDGGSLHLDDVVERYRRASDALSAAMEDAVAAGDVERAPGAARRCSPERVEHEIDVMAAAGSLVGR